MDNRKLSPHLFYPNDYKINRTISDIRAKAKKTMAKISVKNEIERYKLYLDNRNRGRAKTQTRFNAKQ